MKLLSLVALSVLVSSSAFAQEICYKALNPQNITVKTLKGFAQTAVSAQAVFDESRFIDSEGLTHYPSIELKAQTKKMRFSTVASQFDPENLSSYGVECDGGSVRVEKVEGGLILNSNYLAGDIKFSFSVGCSQGTVSFQNLKLKEVACSK